MAQWAAGLGYVGVQVPTSDPALFDLALAAKSQDYCDDVRGKLARHGIAITELSTHLQGQLLACHPAYADMFRGFAAPEVRDDASKWPAWADAAAAVCGARQRAPGPEGARDLFRRAALAHGVPLAAAPGRTRRSRLRRTGAPLAAGARCVRGGGRRRCATRSIRARTCTTARRSSVSSRRWTTIRPRASSTTPATSCCSSSTTSTTSIATTRASRRST